MTTQSEMAASEKEVEKNYAYFKKMQAKWLDGHMSDYALIHRQKLIAFLKARKTPSTLASGIMGGGEFSVQSVRNAPVDLGHQSNALF